MRPERSVSWARGSAAQWAKAVLVVAAAVTVAAVPFAFAHVSSGSLQASDTLHRLTRQRELLQQIALGPHGVSDQLLEQAEDLGREDDGLRKVWALGSSNRWAGPETRRFLRLLAERTRSVRSSALRGDKGSEAQARKSAADAVATANRAVQSAEDDVGRERSHVQNVQAALSAASVLMLLGVGLIVARRYVEGLQSALTEAEAAKARLVDKVQQLRHIKDELQNLAVQNTHYKDQLAKALGEAENANDLLRHASFRFEELFQGLPIACVSVGEDGTIFDWNRAATALFGHTSSAVYLQNVLTLLPLDDDVPAMGRSIVRAVQGEYVREMEWTAKTLQGRTVDILTHAFPIKSMNGTVNGVLISCVDQTERKQATRILEEQLRTIQEMNVTLEEQRFELETANERLEALATTDGLTGLRNHRTFQMFLKQHLDNAQRRFRPFALLLLDVDHFKLFNDEFGHQAGDEILAGVARILESNSRPGDIVSRYGGEEFAVILPDATEAEAVSAADRLRRALQDHDWPYRQVTASFGVTVLETSVKDPATMVSQADQALYASKAAGRNRVSAFSRMAPKAV